MKKPVWFSCAAPWILFSTLSSATQTDETLLYREAQRYRAANTAQYKQLTEQEQARAWIANLKASDACLSVEGIKKVMGPVGTHPDSELEFDWVTRAVQNAPVDLLALDAGRIALTRELRPTLTALKIIQTDVSEYLKKYITEVAKAPGFSSLPLKEQAELVRVRLLQSGPERAALLNKLRSTLVASPLAQSESQALSLIGESGTEIVSEASQGVDDILLELDSTLASLARRAGTGQGTGLLEELLAQTAGNSGKLSSGVSTQLSRAILSRSPALEAAVLQWSSTVTRRWLLDEAAIAAGEGAALVCPSGIKSALTLLPRSFLPIAGMAADFALNPSIAGDATLDTYWSTHLRELVMDQTTDYACNWFKTKASQKDIAKMVITWLTLQSLRSQNEPSAPAFRYLE